MEVGQLVEIIELPETLPDGMGTKEVFEKCLGQSFPVVSIADGLLELEVGRVLGQPDYMHSIWIEPTHVRRVRR